MSHLTKLLNHLESYVQEEIGAQSRTLALLDAQEQAVRTADHTALARANRALDAELGSVAARSRRRGLLLEGFGKLWKIDPGTLTLSSLIERIGPSAERLQRQRADLRELTDETARRARQVGTAARAHQRVTTEILEAVLHDAEGASIEDGGALVNAEA